MVMIITASSNFCLGFFNLQFQFQDTYLSYSLQPTARLYSCWKEE